MKQAILPANGKKALLFISHLCWYFSGTLLNRHLSTVDTHDINEIPSFHSPNGMQTTLNNHNSAKLFDKTVFLTNFQQDCPLSLL